MIRLAGRIAAHIFIDGIIVFDVDEVIVWHGRFEIVFKTHFYIHPPRSVFDKIHLCRLQRIESTVFPFLNPLFIFPYVIGRKDKCIVIQQQQPQDLFQEFARCHKRVRIIQNCLDVIVYRHRVVSVVSDMCRI